MYHKILVAGTFDRLHNGHKALLKKAMSIVDSDQCHIIIEVMPWDYCFKFKKLPYLIQSERERFENVEDFMVGWVRSELFTVVIAKDEYGHGFYSSTLTDIVVGEDARGWAEMINAYRINNKLNPLVVHILKDVEINGGRISSTKLREEVANVR